MSKNILIVESENDKYFIESLKEYLNISDVEIDTPICSIDDYECLNGLSKAKLAHKLQELQIDIEKRGIEKIGIILDADKEGVEKRIELINEALKVIDKDLNITRCNHFIKSESLEIEIACYITNVEGYGELETVLKQIKSKDSPFADCLYDWKRCLEEKSQSIKDKEFDKFWVNTYQRFDCCTKKEQKQAGRKCNPEASMKKDIWNFEHSVLDGLKEFLKLF
ncbi:MAG: hypothetical protein DRR19_19585 [Candidatus Parabeggiatoa sp. nov. 1]|nr:MAG: hypothetical protein DRR19_19585 [Gammaproteobacteria bacterium]